MPYRRVFLSIGAALANLEGVRLRDFERKEVVYLSSFLGPSGY